MAYFLAIDAGGTKTDYLLADESRELARARSASIKRLRLPAEEAAANLEAGLRALTERSGVALRAVAQCCIGSAGYSVRQVTDWLREALAARVGGGLLIVGDEEIALDAAFHGGPGVLVLAGTGSNVAGRGRDGRITTAGGWGPALGDQGSGYTIGSQALRALFLAIDEGRESSLLPAVLHHWQLGSVEELVGFANQHPDFSQLAALVAEAAATGDALACEILSGQGRELGYLARLVLRRMDKRDGFAWPIAFAGSIVGKVAPVRDAVVEEIESEFPAAVAQENAVEPILGALWRARREPAR